MTTPPEPGAGPDDAVDVTVESPAIAARDAARDAARAGARAGAPPAMPGPARPAAPAHRSYRRAWVLAIAADAVQLVFMPLFAPGVVSPANAALDIAVGALLVRWCGWHWAFLPSLAAELVPGLDLVPTWTAAVWIATRGRGGPKNPTA
jgi:hypothetical protein